MIFTFINETLTWALSLSLSLCLILHDSPTHTHTHARSAVIIALSLTLLFSLPLWCVGRSHISFLFFCSFFGFFSKRYLQFMAVFCMLSRLFFFVFLSIHDELEIAHFWAATADSLDHFPFELQVSLIRMRECAKHTHTTLHVWVCVCACALWFCAWLPRSFYIAYCVWHTFCCCCCCWAQMVRGFDRLTFCFLSSPPALCLLPIKMSNTNVYKINKMRCAHTGAVTRCVRLFSPLSIPIAVHHFPVGSLV